MQIENIQKRFTKRVPGCSNLNYCDRLTKLKLQSLEHRRLIADLMMCFNIIQGNNCLNLDDFFKLNPNKSLRGHSLKISLPLTKLNARKYFFSHRIVPIWNSLPNDLVTAPNIVSFRRSIKSTDLSKFLIFPFFKL